MTGKPPPRNLPPDSERWGRWVEDGVRSLEQSDLETSQGVTNALNGLTATLGQLSGQIGVLASQQTTLSAQQATLAAQQTQLTAVVNALPVSSTTTGYSADVTGGGSWTNVATATISVPTGKSQGSFFVSAQSFNTPTSASASAFRLISGSWISPTFPASQYYSGSPHHYAFGSYAASFAVSGTTTFTLQINDNGGRARENNISVLGTFS